ncbi:hypothetical protein GGR56DRAFT_678145 [Xylariaceae sp. FL0804]|nr:hypothetical protein GGR56DRAFT_678145 [Xylariaceae sp. FL0804]
MTTNHPQPPASTPPTPPVPAPPSPPSSVLYTFALVALPLSLVGLALPPRRLDSRFALLGGVAAWSANRLAGDLTGASLLSRTGARVSSAAHAAGLDGEDLPSAAARETRDRLRAERAARVRGAQQSTAAGGGIGREQEGVEEEDISRRSTDRRSWWQRVWLGSERDEEKWLAQREKRENEALREGGEGVSGLIADYFRDAAREAGDMVRGGGDGKGKDQGEKTEQNKEGGEDGVDGGKKA